MTDRREIEKKWQKRWKENGVYEVDKPEGDKVFVTAAYPYPNGLLHLGHLGTYLPADFVSRYHRLKGRQVLFPMGFHVTGPATTGFARAIQRGDQDVIEDYHNVHRVSYDDIESFKDPENIVEYFSKRIRTDFDEIGLSIDWRRTFMTKDSPYTKFITWQFTRLNDDGHLVKGSHPVIWCESCGNAVGEADRVEGDEAEIQEFYILKFQLQDGTILPAATLRPETVFGVTNMWVDPEGDYRRISVGDEVWIVGAEAIAKLSRQKESVEEEGGIDPKTLFGKSCRNPLTGEMVPILPATFVDTSNATGMVMSVPAHAPLDYQAIEDLKSKPELLGGLDPSVLDGLDPISLIEVEGLSDYPAIEVVKDMGISSQDEVDELERATQRVYKREFYEGVLKPITGKYSGRTVSEAKEILSRDFISQGIADVIYELSERVVCRCRTPCHVQVVKDQWFIDYGDADWKQRTRDLLDSMRVVPDKIRKSFEYYVNWMKEKPCARKIGFGTPFLLDPDWIVEPLSDSTIYMAYYTIARKINQDGISPDSLTRELFDYVFLGEGDAGDACESSGLEEDEIESMREEFSAWYPNDIRFVGPDLVGNHATFFLFNHAAIFPPELWPEGIAASGIVLAEGQKMSKSKGNSIPIADSLDQWGADIVRLWFAACAEFGQDINYEASVRDSVARRLDWFGEEICKLADGREPAERDRGAIDEWLLHRINQRIPLVEDYITDVSPRKAIQELMFETYNDLQYYYRRTENRPNPSVLRYVFDIWIRILSPFAPHFCEEMWESLGHEPFVVTGQWPQPEEIEQGPAAEIGERLVRSVLDDVKKILAATGSRYTRLNLYVAEDWKMDLFREEIEGVLQDSDMSSVISSAMSRPEVRKLGKTAVSFIQRTFPDLSRMPRDDARELSQTEIDEEAVLSEATEFISRETGMEVSVQDAGEPEHDPENKAGRAVPRRPAIYLE